MGGPPVDEQGVVHFRARRKLAPRKTTPITLNLAPMVDVVFLLLIFFITTTTFKRAEGLLPSQLPTQGGQSDAVAFPITPIVVRLAQTGTTPTDYSLRIDNFVNAPSTFNELASFLEDIQSNPGFDDETPVIIQTRPEVMWELVVECWNAAVRAGYRRISFGLE